MSDLKFTGFDHRILADALRRTGTPVADLQALIAATINKDDQPRWGHKCRLLFHRCDGLVTYLAWTERASSQLIRSWKWFSLTDTMPEIWATLYGPWQTRMYLCPRFECFNCDHAPEGLLAAAAVMDTVRDWAPAPLTTGTLSATLHAALFSLPPLAKQHRDAWRLYLDNCHEGVDLWAMRSTAQPPPSEHELPTNTSSFYAML